jgi:hypothetical protein
MKLVALHHEEQNYALFDPWSVVHFAAGMFFGLVRVGFWPSLGLAVGYEAFEQFAERQSWGEKIFTTSGAETRSNIATDIGLFAVGWWLTNKYMGG